ncbi:MAG: DUF4349 domain-containing protein [bacterium]|nr:DUF4349 domain-containing protein [bacterium]MDE0440390.1 DUF4349 domain-containing protein [bacterium]
MERTNKPPNLLSRLVVGVLAIVGVVALAACFGGDDEAAESGPVVTAAAAMMMEEDAAGFATGEDGALERSSIGGLDIGAIGRDVIVEMWVTVSSDNIRRTVASIMANVSALGGGVAFSNIEYGDPTDGHDNAYASLVVKVPPEGIDQLLAGLDDTGTVLSISQSAQDVTEQLIDLDVRIRNARQSVVRVREFMGRTEKLSDLVVLEGELTRRQTDLERLEAQQRNLSERVALSTVTIDIVPTASVDDDDPDTFGDAFSTGWNAFVAAMSTTGLVLALVSPFLILAALLALLVWFVVRRRRARTGAAPTKPSPAEGTKESP